MKKVAAAIFILFLVYGTALPQSSCLPEGITFSTQEQIDNFQTNYPGCTEIEGDVKIQGNEITNLNGLNVLTAIGGYLWIRDNPALASLMGLDNVTSIGGFLRIWTNDALKSLSGLVNVTSIGGYFHIQYNDALTSLTGLDNIISIEGELLIVQNISLVSLTGLDNVTSIAGGLHIVGNTTLTSLLGLDNLTNIDGSLVIGFNDALTDFTGLGNMTSIGEGIGILDNDALTSLTGIDNVTYFGGNLEIYDNAALTSLSGLDNIDAASIDDLYIIDNSSLSTCEVLSVCDFLAAPNGSIEIYNNAPGCNSQEEVEEACEGVSVESKNPEEEISVFPNPANRQLTISSKDGTAIEEVIIYNQTGQIILLEKPINNIIDISQLRPGMYIIEVVIGQRRIREKLVIE